MVAFVSQNFIFAPFAIETDETCFIFLVNQK